MIKCILWGTGCAFKENVINIKYHEQCNSIQVVGVTSNTEGFQKILGYRCIQKRDLINEDYDFIVIMAYDKLYDEIAGEAIEMGIEEHKIISYAILSRPYCNVQKYLDLKLNPPTIFSNNCWGGLTYHSLRMKFFSPLINMFEKDWDYLKLLRNPRYYMEQSLILQGYETNEILNMDFPVCSCGDIVLYFNHYNSFEIAKECWERRKNRINWDNVFAMMYTESLEVAEEFSKLPYEKKVCFVPFETWDNSSVHYLEFYKRGNIKEIPFWSVVNSMATGKLLYYDDIELLHSGIIKPICT